MKCGFLDLFFDATIARQNKPCLYLYVNDTGHAGLNIHWNWIRHVSDVWQCWEWRVQFAKKAPTSMTLILQCSRFIYDSIASKSYPWSSLMSLQTVTPTLGKIWQSSVPISVRNNLIVNKSRHPLWVLYTPYWTQ